MPPLSIPPRFFGGEGKLTFDLTSTLTAAEAAALKVHVCDSAGFGFADASVDYTPGTHTYSFDTALDWSPPVATRTLYLSLPANHAATGEPAISGTATAGQVLTADTSPIMDADGLPASFTYQWIRVDADGASNPLDIPAAETSTYTLTDDDVGKKIKLKVSFTDDLSGAETRTSEAFPASATVTAANNAPTSADNTVTTSVGMAYTFTADDFSFADTNAADTLASVRIESLPSAGSLELDTTAVMTEQVVTRAQIDDGGLTFTPVADASGDAYASFTFKVNDGTVDSDNAYTMTINVRDLTCAAPGFGDRRNHWSGTVTVGAVEDSGDIIAYGFDAASGTGSLAAEVFSIGSNSYTIEGAFVGTASGAVEGRLTFDLSGSPTAAEAAALELHVCDSAGFGFTGAGVEHEATSHYYTWDGAALDWSPPVTSRTLYLSLPANHAATGEPTISGTARSGQALTADTSAIVDADGLPASFTYQWIRVDADGASNPLDIPAAETSTYTLTDDDVGKKIKLKVSFTDDLSGAETRTSEAFPASATVTAANNAPTGADNTVTTGVGMAYTFTADDFGFADTDAADTLASVRIESLPSAGSLDLDTTAVMTEQVVTRAQIDDGGLTFTPVADASGDAYASFTFKVNDGTVDSDNAYTMTINVRDLTCAAPGFGDRRNHWSGTVTVGAVEDSGDIIAYGFDAASGTGSLAAEVFSIGSNSYTIEGAFVGTASGAVEGRLTFDLSGSPTAAEAAALELHVCDSAGFGFAGAGVEHEATSHYYTWDAAALDWSPPVATRTLYLSLPANHAATGEPAISGTATAGQELTADTSPIVDADGLPASFTYQWIRVDADGASNPLDIPAAETSTYTLTDDDVGKKVKLKVSFTDDLSGAEERTSEAFPASATVLGVNHAPTGADNTVTTSVGMAYTFTADDFSFADTNAADTLASVRIESVPSAGSLDLDTTAVMAEQVVTKAQIDDGGLTFTPVADASGDAYASFTFKVNDGTVDSDNAYTMTINVRDLTCAAPGFGDRRNHWSGTVTVGADEQGDVLYYGVDEVLAIGGLAPKVFSIGSNSYTIDAAFVHTAAFFGGEGKLTFDLTSTLTAAEAAALKVHVCDSAGFGFADASVDYTPGTHTYSFDTALDWSPPVATRTLYLSLPANHAATGEPAISGTATAGQVLTADTSPIMDADGLPASFTHQWVRVDADGTSNPTPIPDANASTYTLTDDDVGGKVWVEVSFTDHLGNGERRTSAAYPASGTVTDAVAAMVSNVTVSSTPKLTAQGSTSPDTYGVGETIEFKVTFSAAVTVTGDPRFGFSLGNPGQSGDVERLADYDADASTATALVFGYTVQAADEDTDGISVGDQTQTIRLDADDRIHTTSNDVDAVLDHGAPGLRSGHKVAGSRSSAAPALAITDGAVVFADTLTLTYDEALDENSEPDESAFSVSLGGAAGQEPSNVEVSGQTVTLTLATPAAAGQTVTVSYTVPTGTGAMPLLDLNGIAGPGGCAVPADVVAGPGVGPHGHPVHRPGGRVSLRHRADRDHRGGQDLGRRDVPHPPGCGPRLGRPDRDGHGRRARLRAGGGAGQRGDGRGGGHEPGAHRGLGGGRLDGRRGRERDGHGDARHRRGRAAAAQALCNRRVHRGRFDDGRRRLPVRERGDDRGAGRLDGGRHGVHRDRFADARDAGRQRPRRRRAVLRPVERSSGSGRAGP